MSCKLNTSDMLTVTEEGTKESTNCDEKREGLTEVTIQGKVMFCKTYGFLTSCI